MKRRASYSAFQLHLDPPGETLWRLFVVGAVSAIGAAVTLWAISLIASLIPRGGAYLDSGTAFIIVSVLWASVVPATAAARGDRPYLLALSILYAFLGVGGGGLPASGAVIVITLLIYHRLVTRRPRYEIKSR